MFRKLKAFRARLLQYKQSGKVHSDLDVLLSTAKDNRALEDKLQWLVKLLQWIRYEGSVDSHLEKETGRLPVARLRFLLLVLDRNPEWKKNVAIILRTVVHEVSGLELYTETGLPREMGLWGELSDRLAMKILPTPPLDHELGYLFWALFPDKDDPLWVASIDNTTFEKLVELFQYEVGSDEKDWNRLNTDIEDALTYLVIQVRAIGLSPAVRYRLDKPTFRDSAFFALVRGLEEFMHAYHAGDKDQSFEKASRFRMIVWECRRELQQVTKHLEEYGVSLSLVFQMMLLRTYLQRIDSLLEILLTEKLDHRKVTSFLSKLIEENQDLRSIKSLLSQNVSLLAKKVVERAAETGEHYITRTREQYRHMVQAAGGGGAVTALTVYVKVGILALGLSGFAEGMLASVNYAISFVAIHLLGFTLGTKQPAMTAPALAEKMQDVASDKGMDDLVTEITHLIRSQVAAVSGNVLFVVPCAILIDMAFFLLFGNHLMGEDKAHYAYKSVDILGPAVLYGAFTGILLWLSSLAAGWGDNWFALNSLRKTLARSPTLRTIFGKRGARNIAVFLEKNMSGLTGNICLGVFLGMTPEILKFMGIPLDVRHVTLSSGTLGGALPVLGMDFLKTWDFWRAVIGIFFIGAFNVLVSFGLALMVAIKARSIEPPQRRAIRRAVVRRFFSSPLSFFLPVGATVAKTSEGSKH
ncbi:site-specific recombinase [Bdellovibrio sp. 22V]|uniref:site-specific recombinase n=1 Tax=Bdellovibrio TaxID=958 RepID=UPI0025437959|nr:site-specific recombinase [Bdellovibrio sp. 22V]WII71620.1 site-specific recombinase [Bdellovibrio sp. 22V]